MKSKKLICGAMFIVFLAVCGPLFAHHGTASLNTDKEIVIKDATVAKVLWANPHCVVSFDTKDEKGNVVHWAGELGNPSSMNQVGFTRNSVKPGDVVTVYLFQAKTGNPAGRINKVVLADGTTIPDMNLVREYLNSR